MNTVVLLLIGFAAGVVVTVGYFRGAELWSPRADRKIVYRHVDGVALQLHYFRPRAANSQRPSAAVLMYHGGAWQYGSPRQFYAQCEYFARRGIACFSVEYRLGSVHGSDVRDTLADAREALRYVRENASELGIDPDRIAAGGGSAGGHLAAALGVGVPALSSGIGGRPNALLLYNPMLDLSPCKPDHHLVADYWHEISPMHHVDADTPPALVMLGSEDLELPVASVREFAALIEAAGGRCLVDVYDGARHGFFNRSQYLAKTNDAALAFLASIGFVD